MDLAGRSVSGYVDTGGRGGDGDSGHGDREGGSGIAPSAGPHELHRAGIANKEEHL